MFIVVALVLVAVLCLMRVRYPLMIEIEHNNIKTRGKKLMATINTTQKIKLTAIADGAVQAETFEAHIADGGTSVSLGPVEGELAVYANAVGVGSTVVGFSIVSSNGSLLGALVQIDVEEAPANSLSIQEGSPEPL